MSAPPWSRMPPNPATAAVQAPASEAMWTPLCVLPREVVEIDERRLGEVVVGELEMPDLRGDHRLRAGRERRVAHGQRLVVGEVPRLLLVAESIAARMQRQHEIGLLDDLLAVELEVGEVHEQRVLVGPRVRRSPRPRAR